MNSIKKSFIDVGIVPFSEEGEPTFKPYQKLQFSGTMKKAPTDTFNLIDLTTNDEHDVLPSTDQELRAALVEFFEDSDDDDLSNDNVESDDKNEDND